MYKSIAVFLTLVSVFQLFAQTSESGHPGQKTVDEGGSGLFKAIALRENTLAQFVVYRPKDLYWASTRERKLPVLVWGNGGCADTSVGYSCGGAQVLSKAADTRLKTYLILNAGMGEMEMAGASKNSLKGLHGPVLYLTGGESDVAYKNAQLDYERITHVPVAWGDMPKAGHGGTYQEKGGGDFGRMVLSWLDWQLESKTQQKNVFLESDLRYFPDWTMKQKNFGTTNTVEELWIHNGSKKIYGIISKPKNAEKKGIAIICHGFNGTHHFGRDYFTTLNDLGYMVYTFDFPCGSVNSRSDNNTMNMSVIDQKEDVRAIVHYFQQQPDVDRKKIVLIGESQGGLVSALAAGELKKEVAKLVLVYPALSIPDNWNKRYPEVTDIPDTTKLWNVALGRRFFVQLRHMDVYKAITEYNGPVQIIHGSKDAVIPLSYSEEAMKQYTHAHLGVIPGAGHGFRPFEREISNQFVKEFLTE